MGAPRERWIDFKDWSMTGRPKDWRRMGRTFWRMIESKLYGDSAELRSIGNTWTLNCFNDNCQWLIAPMKWNVCIYLVVLFLHVATFIPPLFRQNYPCKIFVLGCFVFVSLTWCNTMIYWTNIYYLFIKINCVYFLNVPSLLNTA